MTEELNRGCLDEREEFERYWLARQRGLGFGKNLTDAEMLAYPDRRDGESHAWKAGRASLSTSKQAGAEPVKLLAATMVEVVGTGWAEPLTPRRYLDAGTVLYTTPPAVMPAAPSDAVTDAMVDAYLKANDAYWKQTDQLPSPPDKWRTGTPREATRVSLAAALSQTMQPAGQEQAGALLTDADLARVYRRVTGANRFDQNALMLMREVEHAVNEKRGGQEQAGAVANTALAQPFNRLDHEALTAIPFDSDWSDTRERRAYGKRVAESAAQSCDIQLQQRLATLAAPGSAIAAREQEAESVALLREAADYFAELYAKYQTKIGPFASKGQAINARIGAYLRATPPAAIPAAPSDAFAATMRNIFGNEFPTHPNGAGEYPGWSDYWAIFQAGAALTQPTTVQQADYATERRWLCDRIAHMVLECEAWKAKALAVEPPKKMAPGDWRIDHSAGRPILTYKNCSVIEAEDAEYVLRLIVANFAPAALKTAQTTALNGGNGEGEL